MWELFVAIFGGMFWGTKLGCDRAASRRADARLAQKKMSWEAWTSRVTDSRLESRIKFNLSIPETAKPMRDNALKIIRSFHGLEYADFNTNYDAKYRDYYVRAMVTYLELVRHGKLPVLNCSDIPNYLELSLDIRPSKRARIEFCKWLEETMQSNGVLDARIYYTGKDYASFAWEPYVYDFSKATSVMDPNIESVMIGEATEITESRNARKIEAKQQKERYAKWKESVDGGEMQQFLELEFNADHWLSVQQATLEFLRTLPGLEYADYWPSNSDFRNKCRDLIFLIEMVKRGKLPQSCYPGIPDDLLHHTLDLYIPRASKIAFAKWIENTLRANGVANAELYYRPKANPRFVFAPNLINLSEAIRITDANLAAAMDGESEELIAARNKPLIQQKIEACKERG